MEEPTDTGEPVPSGHHDWLHGCEARYRPRTGPAAPRGTRPFTVDVHCHVISPLVEEIAAAAPRPAGAGRDALAAIQGEASVRQNERLGPLFARKGWSVEERLSDMDAMGVDMQLLSPSPVQYHYWADADTAEAIVACHNERIARIVADHPDRFAGIGTLAMQHPGLALEQLDHAVRKLGLLSVSLYDRTPAYPVA